MRSLEADSFRPSWLSLLLIVAILGSWLAWFFLARITLYEVSEAAHLIREDRIVADFLPAALGRIRPGQSARLRLDGFPWTQYGTIPATVIRVISQDDNEWLQVELTIRPNLAPAIPFQRGLVGTVEVEVERVSPATLVLRAAGQRLVAPDTSPELLDSRREVEQ